MTDETDGKASSTKGRATPSRKQAEAERRARMKQPMTRKERAKRESELHREKRAKQKAALRAGRGASLPYRDQGPVRAFTRDYVDRRWNVTEYLLPILLVTLGISLFGSPETAVAMVVIYAFTFVAVGVDVFLLQRGLKKELVRRFGYGNIGGDRPYAIMRATQLRFMRLPKAVVRRGEKLPEHYT